MAFPDAARATPALAEGDPCKSVCSGRLTAQHNPTGTFLQAGRIAKPIVDEAIRESLVRLRRRAEFDLVRLDIIIDALDAGIFTSDIAAEIAGISLWPQSLVDAAIEWRDQRYGRAG